MAPQVTAINILFYGPNVCFQKHNLTVKDFFGDNRVVRRFKNFFFLLQKRSGLREKVYEREERERERKF